MDLPTPEDFLRQLLAEAQGLAASLSLPAASQAPGLDAGTLPWYLKYQPKCVGQVRTRGGGN